MKTLVHLSSHNSSDSLTFSSDGQLLASGGLDGLIQVWDVSSGSLKHTLEGPEGGIEVIIQYINYNQQTICTGSEDASLRIWNPKSGENLHVIRGHPYHTEGLTCSTITSDSTLAITGSKDNYVRVVNITTGKLLSPLWVVTSLLAHTDSIECIGLGQSFQWAATGSMDHRLIIWDLQHSSVRLTCEHEDGVTCLEWLGSSSRVATGCMDGRGMREVQLGQHTVRSHGREVARTHMHDWLMLLLLVAIEIVMDVIHPFYRFVGKDMMTDLKYPLKENTVPFWAVQIYSSLLPILVILFIYYRRRDVYDLHHGIL
ncbi:Lipid phosphate phosphatase, partial [Thalictrum thalictroides]